MEVFMKKTIKKIAFVLIVLMLLASTVTGCVEIATGVAKGAVEGTGVLVKTGSEIGGALSDYARAAKVEMPLLNLKRISKGVYTVDVDAWSYRYSETQRKNAINLLVQLIGYESYDFKMTGEPSFRKKSFNPVWSYSITMPGSIPVVRNDKYSSFKIADTICTTLTDATLGESKINGIAYGDGKFVAVGEKKIVYSSDGITWTAVNNKTINCNFEDIAYGNGKFIAVGYYGGGKIMYSSDGVNWTDVKTSIFKSIGSIVYGNGMFVAASKYDDGNLAYSPDGVNWTQVKTFPFRKKYINIAYCEGKFFVFDRYDNDNMAYSSDGVNWTAMKNPLGRKNNINNIVYGNGKFIAVGWDTKTAYSSDGINWTVAESITYVPIYSNRSNSIVYGNGKFVAVGNSGKMAYSSDGITWVTIADSTFGTVDIYDIAFGNGKFVVVGDYGKIAYWNGNIE
jgi:hypothetical protein